MRTSFLFAIAICVISGGVCFTQGYGWFFYPLHRSGSLQQHLTLLLSQNPTPERPDSRELETCLSKHVPLACTLISITVKNESEHTLLTWWETCGRGNMDFDLQRPDGAWESFPSSVSDVSDDPSVLVCTMSGSRAQKLAPTTSMLSKLGLPIRFLDWTPCCPHRTTGAFTRIIRVLNFSFPPETTRFDCVCISQPVCFPAPAQQRQSPWIPTMQRHIVRQMVKCTPIRHLPYDPTN